MNKPLAVVIVASASLFVLFCISWWGDVFSERDASPAGFSNRDKISPDQLSHAMSSNSNLQQESSSQRVSLQVIPSHNNSRYAGSRHASSRADACQKNLRQNDFQQQRIN